MAEKSSYPLVSLGIPTCNGAKRIHRALESIWIQGYPNIEVIVSDNASTDHTKELVLASAKKHPQIRYIRQEKNLGLLGNFEFTLKQAKGVYFMWISDDDQLQDGILLKYVRFLEQNPEYSLVSGQILYWKNQTLDFVEGGFTLEGGSPILRTISYYSRVVYGGMFHGMTRTSLAGSIPVRRVFANDFHFTATLAYLGKIKNFNCPGYHKFLGGSSSNVKNGAKSVGESDVAIKCLRLKMSYDAFAEVFYRSPVFDAVPVYTRLPAGMACFFALLIRYYGWVFPLSVAGRIKRFAFSIFGVENPEGIFKKRSKRRLTI